jgi:hypothetical protein
MTNLIPLNLIPVAETQNLKNILVRAIKVQHSEITCAIEAELEVRATWTHDEPYVA